MADYTKAWLDPKSRALLDFAVQVTRKPSAIAQETIDKLRGVGWSDEDLLQAVHIIGFFNYFARLADALGVDAEDFMK